MTTATPLQEIAENLPIFTSREQKKQFLFVLGALTARIISLRKAAEVMNIDSEALLQISSGPYISYQSQPGFAT